MSYNIQVGDISIEWMLEEVNKEEIILEHKFTAITSEGSAQFKIINKEELSPEIAFKRILEDTHYVVSTPELIDFMSDMGIEDNEIGKQMFNAHKELLSKFQSIGIDENNILLLAENLLGL
ncbi:MAG: hypothetical protein GF311_11130 [Candidatus Lokiarchaeota archaeon]|nr:hypothetical protein [Candidatus Lokiarchaeota archaeon]MBD3213150.1 hypothetical protein [Candidatus Lokiarchaeota archaeon]